MTFDLERFVEAQDGIYPGVLDELRAGRKTSHWMWFVFPQIAGLGRTETSRRYAIGSLDEARAYLAHPVLGPRLIECARLVAGTRAQSAEQIFGSIDALKLRSSMTLFERAAPDEPAFAAGPRAVLRRQARCRHRASAGHLTAVPSRSSAGRRVGENRAMRQDIAFARSADGTRIAWARHGHGPPLVRVGTWLTHLEHDWSSPVWTHWLNELSRRFTVIRYDDRGSGLSDRTDDISVDAWLADLEAVVDAARVERFALLGMSQAGALGVLYAVRHPERVSHLILYGAYARGMLARDPSPEDREEAELHARLIKVGWGRADPVFRRVFTMSFIPGANETQLRWFDELQRLSTPTETALRSHEVRAEIDVSAAATTLTVPTLVLHAVADQAVPFEEGRRLAALIPGARFVPLDGRNHILLADEPAWPAFLDS